MYYFSDADCILVAVLSHGEMGILYSNDQPYKPDRLWSHFNAEKCPTLAGKPKLFFVQVSVNFHSEIVPTVLVLYLQISVITGLNITKSQVTY